MNTVFPWPNVKYSDVPGLGGGGATFASIADGLAATEDGDIFIVATDTGAAAYKNVSGSGVKLYDLNGESEGGDPTAPMPFYTLTSELKGDIAAGFLSDGDVVNFNGLYFQVDSDLDDQPLSWFYNTKGDTNPGLRALSPVPYNHFLYVAFLTQGLNKVYLYNSADGLNFRALNNDEIPRGQGNSTVGSRDHCPRWISEIGQWLIPYTNGVDADFDFGFWRTPDLTVWDSENSFYGTNPTGIRGTTLPGGSVPCEYMWSPKLERFDGTWYMMFAAQYGPMFDNPYTGDTGPTSRQFQPFICEVTDLNTLTTTDPVRMIFPHPSGSTPTEGESSMLSPDIIKHTNGYFYAAIKSDYFKNILIYRNATLTGTWTYIQTIDQDGDADPLVMDSLEGPIWQTVRYIHAEDHTLRIKHRLMMSDNRDADNNLVEKYVYVEFDDGPEGEYSVIDNLKFDTPTRNGGIVNLTMEEDPRALLSVQAAQAAFGGHGATAIRVTKKLEDGVPLFPQQDTLYYWQGDTDLNITIHKTYATRFWLQCESFAGAKLYVTGDDVVNDSFGHNGEDCYEMRWMPHIGEGKYLRVGGAKNNAGSDGTPTPSLQYDKRIETVGHRGATHIAPEDTMASISAAYHMGYDGVEMDVRFTSDGVPILMHDATVDRTTSQTGNVSDLSLATIQSSSYEVGSWFEGRFAGCRVPKLEDVLDFCRGRFRRLHLEIKEAISDAEADLLVEMVEDKELVNEAIFISFNRDALAKIKARNSGIGIGYINSSLAELDEIEAFSGPKYCSFTDAVLGANAGIVQTARSMGIEPFGKATNTWEEAQALIDLGYRCIQSDNGTMVKPRGGIGGDTYKVADDLSGVTLNVGSPSGSITADADGVITIVSESGTSDHIQIDTQLTGGDFVYVEAYVKKISGDNPIFWLSTGGADYDDPLLAGTPVAGEVYRVAGYMFMPGTHGDITNDRLRFGYGTGREGTCEVFDIRYTVSGADKLSGSSSGALSDWSETSTSLHPVADGGELGTSTKGVGGLWSIGLDASGDPGTERRRLFMKQNGTWVSGLTTGTATNEGEDLMSRQYHDYETLTGTITWLPHKGSGINVVGAMTGNLTINLTNMKPDDTLHVRTANRSGFALGFTPPSGAAVEWYPANPGAATGRAIYEVEMPGASNVIVKVWQT